MSATVTITGKAGPDKTITAGVFNNVTNISFDCVSNVVSFTDENGHVQQIDINAAGTITVTKSSSTYTFAIS